MDALLAPGWSQWGWLALWSTAGLLIGGAVGFSRGRLKFGLLLGFVLGPLVFFVMRAVESHLIECPECSRMIQRTARRCRHCGANLDQARRLTTRQKSKHHAMR